MPDRTKIIGVRVTPDEREKFEDYLEETNEFNSLSRFFRALAHRHIESGEEDVSVDSEEIMEAVDAAVSPVVEKLDQLEEHVVAIDSTVSNDDKIDKLARDIYRSLPIAQDASELPSIDSVDQYENASDFDLVQAISTPYLWAEYFDEDVADVRRSCARMLEYFPDVDYVRADVGTNEEAVPTHDDIGLAHDDHAPDHTDFSSGTTNRSGNQRQSVSDEPETGTGSTIERRYYKTEGR